jgi:hypothetical protein
MKLTVPHTKSGKCPKGAVEKKKGRSRRSICYLRGRHGMGRKRR